MEKNMSVPSLVKKKYPFREKNMNSLLNQITDICVTSLFSKTITHLQLCRRQNEITKMLRGKYETYITLQTHLVIN